MHSRPTRANLPRRGWLRFSLRTLLVAMLLVSLPLAWLRSQLAQARAEQKLAAEIRADGGDVSWSSGRKRIVAWLTHEEGSAGNRDSPQWVTGLRGRRSAIVSRLPQIATCFTGLEELVLDESLVRDIDLRDIERLSQLKTLELDYTQVTDESLTSISRLSKLHTLNLGFTDISGAGLMMLARLPQLSMLSVVGTQVSAAEVEHFRRLRPQVVVNWSEPLDQKARTAARGLKKRGWTILGNDSWARFPPPQELEIVPPTWFYPMLSATNEREWLSHFPKLKVVTYGNGPKQMARFFADFERLDSFTAFGDVEDNDLQWLSRCPRLRELTVAHYSLNDHGLAALSAFPVLETLTLNADRLTRVGLVHVAQVRSLKRLSLQNLRVAEGDLAVLSALPELAELELHAAHFSEQGTLALSALTNLRVLNVGHSNLDDTTLPPILALSNLAELESSHTQMTDAGAIKLAELRSLRKVGWLFGLNITEATESRFRQLRPDVEIGNFR